MRIRRHEWRFGRQRRELWTIQGGGHIPALAHPTWGDSVWAFMKAHPKK